MSVHLSALHPLIIIVIFRVFHPTSALWLKAKTVVFSGSWEHILTRIHRGKEFELLPPFLLKLFQMVTLGVPHCLGNRQTHMAQDKDALSVTIATNLPSKPSQVRAHQSHQLSKHNKLLRCNYIVA
jgi:hypothetical protein